MKTTVPRSISVSKATDRVLPDLKTTAGLNLTHVLDKEDDDV